MIVILQQAIIKTAPKKVQSIRKTYSINDWVKEFPSHIWSKLFTPNEIDAYGRKKSKGSLVARYLIKKTIIEQGITNDFLNIEILNAENGRPVLSIFGENESGIHVSLSHSKTDVAVIVVFDEKVKR